MFPNNAPFSSVSNYVDEQNLFGDELRSQVQTDLPRQFRIGFLLEQLPDPGNCVTVDENFKDPLGNYIPILKYDYDDYTLAGAAAATEFIDLLFARLGIQNFTSQANQAQKATKIYKGVAYNFWGSGHLIGTHLMGSRGKSVVNVDQRTWDHDNLYLVGCGSQPTSATANPTLTMMALALRTSEKIAKALEGVSVRRSGR